MGHFINYAFHLHGLAAQPQALQSSGARLLAASKGRRKPYAVSCLPHWRRRCSHYRLLHNELLMMACYKLHMKHCDQSKGCSTSSISLLSALAQRMIAYCAGYSMHTMLIPTGCATRPDHGHAVRPGYRNQSMAACATIASSRLISSSRQDAHRLQCW